MVPAAPAANTSVVDVPHKPRKVSLVPLVRGPQFVPPSVVLIISPPVPAMNTSVAENPNAEVRNAEELLVWPPQFAAAVGGVPDFTAASSRPNRAGGRPPNPFEFS